MTCEQFCQLRFVNNPQDRMPIFDKSRTNIYTRDEACNGKTIHVIGL